MSFDGSGNYTKPVTAVTPAVSGTVIDSSAMNTYTTDVEAAFNVCMARDGQSPATANLPMATYRHTGVGDAVALTDYASANQVVDNTLNYAGASAAGTDAYSVSLPISPGSYSTGLRFQFLSDVANTGACTCNLNLMGVKNIKLADGSDPADGDIPASSFPDLMYDGTNLVLLNPWSEQLAGLTATVTELNYNDIATLGTAQASKVLTLDASGDLNMNNIGRIDNCETVQFNSELNKGNAGATHTITFDNAQKQKITIDQTTTITLANPTSVGNFQLKIINGSAFTITWSTTGTLYWANGGEPAWQASGIDIAGFYFDGTDWYAQGAMNFV